MSDNHLVWLYSWWSHWTHGIKIYHLRIHIFWSNLFKCISVLLVQETTLEHICEGRLRISLEHIFVSLFSYAVWPFHSLLFLTLTPLVSFKGSISILFLVYHNPQLTSSSSHISVSNTFSFILLCPSFNPMSYSLILVYRKMYCPSFFFLSYFLDHNFQWLVLARFVLLQVCLLGFWWSIVHSRSYAEDTRLADEVEKEFWRGKKKENQKRNSKKLENRLEKRKKKGKRKKEPKKRMFMAFWFLVTLVGVFFFQSSLSFV